jgi:hypothetical protein
MLRRVSGKGTGNHSAPVLKSASRRKAPKTTSHAGYKKSRIPPMRNATHRGARNILKKKKVPTTNLFMVIPGRAQWLPAKT